MKKRYPILAGILSLVLLASVAGCGGGGGNEWYDKDIWYGEGGAAVPTVAAKLPTEANFGFDVYVHDPSIFYDTDSSTYYAFGTHYAVASSKDLISWKQENSDNNFEALYGKDSFTYSGKNWPKALEEIVKTVDVKQTTDTISTTWAPDVMKLGSKYYMYFSITEKFGSGRSAIGRVSSRNVMGPYSNAELLLLSENMGGQPNCIDPELFYDKEGNLYMVYGSFYGGIFIKELTEDGLPVVSDPTASDYFGTLLWKGDRTGVEGPFIFYNAETDYYYLMVSDGSLSTNYTMRVARSKDPKGPYTDIANTDLTKNPRNGIKLAGNYQFSGDEQRKALGHNSVIKKDGEYLVVCHVRNAAGAHHVEVHQLYFNKDGWPVMSPNRYAGEAAGTVKEADLLGAYDVVVHSAGTTETVVNSVRYTLAEGGKVMSGTTEAGTWSLDANGYYFTITLNDVTYNGVAAPGWRNYGEKKGIYCMTATSDAGLPVWLNAAN